MAMQYTEQQKAEFKQQYSTRRRNQIILFLPLVALVVLVGLSEGRGAVLGIPMTTAGPIAIVLILCGVIFSLYNWRCPACNKHLGKGLSPRFCAKCGVELK
jgi:hypothetical protein